MIFCCCVFCCGVRCSVVVYDVSVVLYDFSAVVYDVLLLCMMFCCCVCCSVVVYDVLLWCMKIVASEQTMALKSGTLNKCWHQKTLPGTNAEVLK